MKKILITSIFIISTLLLNSCWESEEKVNQITNSNSWNDTIMINNIDDWNTYDKANLNYDKNNEATEEVDATATWESATVTSFWSWKNSPNEK